MHSHSKNEQKTLEAAKNGPDSKEPLQLGQLQSLKKALEAAEIQKKALESALNLKEQAVKECQTEGKEQEDHFANQISKLKVEVVALKSEVSKKRKECRKLKKKLAALKIQFEAKLLELVEKVDELQEAAREIAQELSDEKIAHSKTKNQLEAHKSSKATTPSFGGSSLFPHLNLDFLEVKSNKNLTAAAGRATHKIGK